MAIQKGDKVNYIPHICHAKQRYPKDHPTMSGEFSWVFGWKTGNRRQVPGNRQRPGTIEAEVVELTHHEAELKIRHIRKQAPERMAQEAAKLVFIRPNGAWNATVRAAAGEDGKPLVDKEGKPVVHLDIADPTTGVTLHYDNVPVDDAKTPHTCHAGIPTQPPQTILQPPPAAPAPADGIRVLEELPGSPPSALPAAPADVPHSAEPHGVVN